ncbi:MAG: hypothetical protein P9L94_05790 [Candidatus Hinthialibacter antarcticus]|nr:hypothetical protein [Candidatus Hinthialibacter antarcticus]
MLPPDSIPTLKGLGIDKMLASRVQTLARVNRPVYDRYIHELLEKPGESLTFAAVHRLCKREITAATRTARGRAPKNSKKTSANQRSHRRSHAYLPGRLTGNRRNAIGDG